MYRQKDPQMYLEEFVLPFEGKMRKDNRQVELTEIIPWEEIEKDYAKLFPNSTGTLANPVRMALEALIIKEKCGYSDRETIEQICGNPYQYFIGLPQYQDDHPFDPSLMSSPENNPKGCFPIGQRNREKMDASGAGLGYGIQPDYDFLYGQIRGLKAAQVYTLWAYR